MNLGIRGKRALICAASKGLGRAIALSLAKEGVQTFICARNEDELKSLAAELGTLAQTESHYLSCDLSIPNERESLIAAVRKKMGSLDILIHNIGGPKPSTILGTTIDDWTQSFEQMFLSIASLNLAFVPSMKEQKWGRVVAVTSLSVLEPVAMLPISNALRSAVTAMLKTLSDDVASGGVTVNCVAPGAIWTNRYEQLIENRSRQTGKTKQALIDETVSSIPLGRFGKSEEFAAAVAFLCSEPASYITGSTICVDGGKRRSTY